MIKRMRKISSKLIASFLIVTIVSSIAGVLGFVLLSRISAEYEYALVNYGFAQGSIGHLGMALNENRAWIRDIVYQTEQSRLNEAHEKIQKNTEYIANILPEVEATNTSDEAKAIFEQIKKELSEYSAARDRVVAYGMNNEQAIALKYLNEDVTPKINAIIEKTEQLMDMNTAVGTQVSQNLVKTSTTARFVMVAVSILGFIVSIAMAFSIARSISKPIIEMQKASKQLAAGDFTFKLETNLRDEVGLMIHSFNEAAAMLQDCIYDLAKGLGEVANGNFDVSASVEFKGDLKQIEDSILNIIVSLSKTLSQINVSADQVASGSEQVSSGAQALSQGATEQASSIEELGATIAEISEQVKQNAERATKANDMVEGVGKEIGKSNEQMTAMITAMDEINNGAAEIEKIIKTIEDIAFQTNILALNAAVEAARAGAAGKGFAVVADEVRNLASKSQEAAKNTTRLIQSAIDSVHKGTSIAGETANSLVAVVSGAKEITQFIRDIATATNEQAQSIVQVTIGVDQISSVVQNNSATAEESAATSQELSGQAMLMRNLISRFKLKRE